MDDMVMKGFGAWTVKDEVRGEVEAEIATIGEVDRDLDVFLPGSTPAGMKIKLSAYDHDVIKRGAPPAGIATVAEVNGKVMLKGRFFLTTERGREAFATVKELGADGEWSIGFPNGTVKLGQMTAEMSAKGVKRPIAYYEPMEASPVFRGAQYRTRTVSVKSADGSDWPLDAVDAALTERNAGAEQPWTLHEALPAAGAVIIKADTKLLQVPVSFSDGSAFLGEPVEVEHVYQPVSTKVEKEPEPEPVVEPPAPEPVATKSADEIEQEMLASVFANVVTVGALTNAQATAEAARAESERIARELTAKRAKDEAEQKELGGIFQQMQKTARRLGAA